MSPRNHSVPLAESQHHVIDPTNPGRALDDGVKDRLHVCRRAADDAEHLGRRRLMLQGLAQFCIALANSLNRRTFSMAITAWSAKVLRRAICLSVKGRTSVRRIKITPIGSPSRSNGVTRRVRVPVSCWKDSGNSDSISAKRSCTCIVWRSIIARPVGRPRVIVSPLAPAASNHILPLAEGHRHQGDRSQHPSHHITSQQSRQQYPTPVEYPSASWR